MLVLALFAMASSSCVSNRSMIYLQGATKSYEVPKEIEKAFELAREEDVIIAFGSLSFIGKMTDIVEEHKNFKKVKRNNKE